MLLEQCVSLAVLHSSAHISMRFEGGSYNLAPSAKAFEIVWTPKKEKGARFVPDALLS